MTRTKPSYRVDYLRPLDDDWSQRSFQRKRDAVTFAARLLHASHGTGTDEVVVLYQITPKRERRLEAWTGSPAGWVHQPGPVRHWLVYESSTTGGDIHELHENDLAAATCMAQLILAEVPGRVEAWICDQPPTRRTVISMAAPPVATLLKSCTSQPAAVLAPVQEAQAGEGARRAA